MCIIFVTAIEIIRLVLLFDDYQSTLYILCVSGQKVFFSFLYPGMKQLINSLIFFLELGFVSGRTIIFD